MEEEEVYDGRGLVLCRIIFFSIVAPQAWHRLVSIASEKRKINITFIKIHSHLMFVIGFNFTDFFNIVFEFIGWCCEPRLVDHPPNSWPRGFSERNNHY